MNNSSFHHKKQTMVDEEFEKNKQQSGVRHRVLSHSRAEETHAGEDGVDQGRAQGTK